MKRVQALKNKQTGDIEKFPTSKSQSFGESLNYPSNKYSKVICLLIEESELRERIKEAEKQKAIKYKLGSFEDAQYYQGQIDLLNSLTAEK